MRTRLSVAVIAILTAALFLASNPGAAFAETPEEELARRHVPWVAINQSATPCGPGEPFYPVAVEVVLSQPGTRLLGPNGEVVLAPSAEDLATRGDGWHLDLPGNALDGGCDYARWFSSLEPAPLPLVYAHIATEDGRPGELALQYWMFWPFNDWNGRHEGDWELIQLTFDAPDAASALGMTPSRVTFAQHSGSETRAWLDAFPRRNDEFGDPPEFRVGDHVAVYPALGSHAAYFDRKRWFASNAATGLACDDARAPSAVLTPVVLLVGSKDDPAAPWLSFGGRWGEEHAAFNNGPPGPAFQQPWDAPFSWMEGDGNRPSVAMPWPNSFAADAFCGATRSFSRGYNQFLELGRPPLAIAGVVGLVSAAVALRTAGSRRGQLAWRPNRRTTTVLLAAGLLATAWVVLLARTTAVGDVVEIAGANHPMTSVSLLLLGAPITLPALARVERNRGWRAALVAGVLGTIAGVVVGVVSGQPHAANLVASLAALGVLSLREMREDLGDRTIPAAEGAIRP